VKTETTSKHLDLHRKILGELGHTLEPGATVLDYGCGAGNMVDEYRRAGYDAFGCDIRLESVSEHLNPINPQDGSIPFPDASFDFVFSDQVMEHVRDHRKAFSEIERVMKRGAVSLHIFPSKLKPVEGHVFVPLGGLIQSRGWLRVWATLGIRNSFQQGKTAREVVELNSSYLNERTNYLSREEIIDSMKAHFPNAAFVEEHMLKHSYGNARRIYPLAKVLPFVARLYSTFYSRVVFLRKN